MKPWRDFWQSDCGSTTLYCGEALRVLDTFDDASIDSIITDPPYCAGSIGEAQRTQSNGQGLRSANLRRLGWFIGDNMGTAGLTWLIRSVAFEATRFVRPTGSVLIFCDWRMLASLEPAVESAGLRFQTMIVWDKRSMGLGTGFRSQHELILHYTLGSPEYHDQGTGNVLRFGRVPKDDREHQTQKPTDLLATLIRVVAPKTGSVVDPFMGSGSTGVACVETGRRFIGIDRDPKHFANARRRCEESLKGGFALRG